MNEYLMSINDFNEPKILSGNDAIACVIIRILLLEPGTIQSHPEMGVGLIKNYRYMLKDELERKLPTVIENQIHTYMPELMTVKVDVITDEKDLILKISTIDSIIVLNADFEKNKIYNLSEVKGDI